MHDQTDLKETALHEVGHALAAWLHGLRFDYASIYGREIYTPDGELSFISDGAVAGLPDISTCTRDAALREARMITVLAGPVAQALDECVSIASLDELECYGGGREDEAGTDMVHALELQGASGEGWVARQLQSTTDMLARRWSALQALADALLTHKVLSYEDCVRVIKPHCKRRLRAGFASLTADKPA